MSFKIGKATVLSRLDAEFYQGAANDLRRSALCRSLILQSLALRFCANLLGELCGLMGESGSGKTTLLNVLGGRAHYGKVQGRVNLNRHRYEPERIKLGFVRRAPPRYRVVACRAYSLISIAQVPQAYLIFKELTVWENLWYAARHRVSLKTATTYEIARAVPQSPRAALLRIRLSCQYTLCRPCIPCYAASLLPNSKHRLDFVVLMQRNNQ